MASPWVFNVRSPTRYRMNLAKRFSEEGRRIFGDRWKGLYVIGSTASRMASHLSDLDVFPLVQASRKPVSTEPVHSDPDWRELEQVTTRLERETGVFIEVWMGTGRLASSDAEFFPLELFLARGAHAILDKTALLLDANPGLALPDRIGIPDLIPPGYREKAHFQFRGETADALKARLAHEQEQCARRRRLAPILRPLVSTLNPAFLPEPGSPESGLFRRWIAGLVLINGFIGFRYGAWNRLAFMAGQEPEVLAALEGRLPETDEMEGAYRRFAPSLRSIAPGLLELQAGLYEAGFSGLPEGIRVLARGELAFEQGA